MVNLDVKLKDFSVSAVLKFGCMFSNFAKKTKLLHRIYFEKLLRGLQRPRLRSRRD